MAFLVWEPSFSIGVWEIDRQHRLLIGLINQLHEAVSGVDPDKKPQAVFAATVECVRNHFAFEESFFERLGYEDLVAHKGSHKQLLDQLSDLRRQFDAGSVSVSPELVKLLKEWMTTHILQCAHRYAELAAERSQRLMVTSSVADVACMPCA
ncbi:MAG: bacteriohemerythrin [Bryobacteraceae bacterium]|jgi:hemerythrin